MPVVTEERSQIGIRIHLSEVRIRGSGSAPKYHRSPSLLARPADLYCSILFCVYLSWYHFQSSILPVWQSFYKLIIHFLILMFNIILFTGAWRCWQEFTMRSKFKGKYLEIEPIGNSDYLLIIWRDESIPPCRRVSDTSRHRCDRSLLLRLVHLSFHSSFPPCIVLSFISQKA